MKHSYLLPAIFIISQLLYAQSNLQKIGHWGYTAFTTPHEVQGDSNFVFMVFENRIVTFDIRNPEDPKLVSYETFEEDVNYLEVQDSLAYIVLSSNYVTVYNISDITNWEYRKLFRLNNYCYDAAIWGALGYFASTDSGLEVWTVRGIPYRVTSIPSGNGPFHQISRHDNFLFVSDWSKFLKIFDITDRNHPELISSVPGSEIIHDMTYKEGYLYACSDVGTEIYNLTDPANPILIDTLQAGQSFYWTEVNDDLLVLSSLLDDIIYLYDISDPGGPELLSNIDGIDPSHVHIYGDLLMVSEFHLGLFVYDISDPANPVRYTRYDTNVNCKRITKKENYLYAASSVSGLTIIDCSNPQAPEKVFSMYPGAVVNDVDFYQDILFMSGSGEKAIMAVDINNPQSPEIIYSIPLTGVVNEFAFKDNYLFVPESGLYVFDMSDVGSPVQVAKIEFPIGYGSIEFCNDIAVVGGNGQVFVIDAIIPEEPELISTIDISGLVYQITVYDNYVYAACGESGLQVYDISDPANYQYAGTFQIGQFINVVETVNDTLFATTENSKIRMYKLVNPMHLVSIGYHDNCRAFDYIKEGDTIYVTGLTSGIDVLKYGDPLKINETSDFPEYYYLSQNYPNPFNPSTVISFNLPERSFVKLRVFNLLGEEIVQLIDQELEKGIHQCKFNAENITSGVYIYQIEANNFTESKKMLLIR